MLIPTLIGGLGMGGKLLKNLAGVGDPNTFQLRLVGDTLKIIQSQAKSTTPVLDNMWSVFSKGDKAGKQVNSSMTSVGTTIGSKVIPSLKGIVTAGGKALAGMLAFQGAIAVIGLLAKGWDHLKNGVKNAEKALESTLQTQQEEIDKKILIEQSKNNIKLSREEIANHFEKALRLESKILIDYMIKEIKVFEDKIIIQFNNPLQKSPDSSQGFLLFEEYANMPKHIQNKIKPIMIEFELNYYI